MNSIESKSPTRSILESCLITNRTYQQVGHRYNCYFYFQGQNTPTHKNMRVSSLFVLLILTEIHFVTSRFPKKPIRAITINEATDKDDLQTQIFTFVDLGFNFIFLGYGQDKNVAGKKVSAPIGALKYYFEISRTDRLLLKSYIASKGVKLIYAMGGPTQPMEKVIKEIGGYSWANQNILRAAEFGFDGFFMDLYFKPRDNCERLLKDDLCMVKNDEKCKKVEDIYHDDDSDKYTYYSSFLELMLEQLVNQPKFTSSALFGYSLPASAFRSDLELGFSNFLLPRTSLELTDLHENKQCQENLSALAYDYTAEEYEEFLQQPNHLLCGIELTLPKHKLRENHIPMPNAVFNEKNIKTGKGLYYDFIIPRYFTGGDCYSNYLSDIDKISQLSNYSSYTRIFDDKHNLFDYNLTANIPSDWRSNNVNLIRNQTNESSESSIEGISNSYKYNFDQERYVGKAENELKEANFQQYAKSRIIPGFTLENEVLDTRYPDSNKMIANSDEYISLDNLTNWSCLKRKFDIQFQSEDYNFWSDKANSKYKQLTGNETEIKFNHTNIYVPQYAFFTGSMGFEDLRMGVLERFMGKVNYTCSEQLNVTKFATDYIENSSSIDLMKILQTFLLLTLYYYL